MGPGHRRHAAPRALTAAARRQARGREAEEASARFLETNHCRVLLRNYRCRLGELDLVASDRDEVLVIAEVRLRSRRDFGSAAESVTRPKQHRIVLATRHLLSRRPALACRRIRFDVLEVTPDETGFAIHWIRQAFDAG
jgi:putative endonuclease